MNDIYLQSIITKTFCSSTLIHNTFNPLTRTRVLVDKATFINFDYIYRGIARGDPGVSVPPPFCKPFLSKVVKTTWDPGEYLHFDTVSPPPPPLHPFEKSWFRPWYVQKFAMGFTSHEIQVSRQVNQPQSELDIWWRHPTLQNGAQTRDTIPSHIIAP